MMEMLFEEACKQKLADAQLFHSALGACADWQKAIGMLARSLLRP